MQSGLFALRAAATDDGCFGATVCVKLLTPIFAQLLEVNPQDEGCRICLDESLVLQALAACEGRLPLFLSSKGSVACARGYNAVSAGWGVLAWGHRSGRCQCRIGDLTYAFALRAQAPKSRIFVAF